jgi:hypothetical protein
MDKQRTSLPNLHKIEAKKYRDIDTNGQMLSSTRQEHTKRSKSSNIESTQTTRRVKKDVLAAILAQTEMRKPKLPVENPFSRFFEKSLVEIPRLNDISEIVAPLAKETERKIQKLNKSYSSQIRISKDLYLNQSEMELLKQLKSSHSPKKRKTDIRSNLNFFKTQLGITKCKKEHFKQSEGEEGYFWLKTENLHFPLEVVIDLIPAEANYMFEIFVSSSNVKPNFQKHDYKFITKHFFVKYGSHPENLFFCLNSVSHVELTITIIPSSGNN